MKGFFNLTKKKPDMRQKKTTYKIKREGVSTSTTRRSKQEEQVDACEVCGLYKKCQSPKMKYSGLGEKQILIIAEAPGQREDEKGTQLIGEAGQLLRKHLKQLGMDLDKDFWKTNSVICRPPANRKPTRKELKLCKEHLEKTIDELKPKFIWLMGGSSIESFYMDRFSDLSVNIWRRRLIPDYDHKCFVIPMFHPSYVLRNKDEKLENIFSKDLRWALSCLGKELPPPINIERARVLTKEKDILDLLENIIEEKQKVVFDYETSSLNPFLPNPKIWTIGVNDCSFGLDHPQVNYDTEKITSLWKQILKDKNIAKKAHNVQFEDGWSRSRFGVIPQGWMHDTMVSQHIIDYRQTSTALKFQAFVKWGVGDYEKDTKKYMPYEGRVNNLDQMPLNDLCKYNAIDALLTKKLWKCQVKDLIKNKDLKKADDLFFDGTLAFCDIKSQGICVNDNWFLTRQKELSKQIEKFNNKLINGIEGRKFKEKTGKEINVGSNKDLVHLLFDILKIKATKQTANGNPSVDVEALANINSPFVKDLLSYRKLIKIRDTYLAQFIRESIDGKIHPSFNLHTVDTYRSCVAKGTKILVVRDFTQSPEGIPIEEVKKGDLVYCFDDELKPSIRKVKWAGKTGTREVIRLHWKGTRGRKGYLDVTPEHLIRLTNGHYVQAQEFTNKIFRGVDASINSPKNRVLSCSRKGDRLRFTDNAGICEHRFIYEHLIGGLVEGEVIHHKNGDHLDHRISNLQKLPDLASHSRIHIKTNFTYESYEKASQTRRERIKQGLITFPTGENNPNFLGLSKWDCLRILTKSTGKTSKKITGYDFETFKQYSQKYNIDQKIVRLRYDKKGKFISKKRFAEASKQGIEYCRKEFGHNYYRLKTLYDFFGVPFKRKWGNQFGEFVVNNHAILSVEILEGKTDVYDLEVSDFNNFFANEICVHNSSSNPNFQNIPVRDEEAKKEVRSGIVPSKGNKLLEIDYSSMEVRICACYTKDPNLITYINNPKSDMHFDQAKLLFKATSEEVSDDMRFYTKNGFVFPEIYGSYFKTCAVNLWEVAKILRTKKDIPLLQHLRSQGIKSLDDFIDHVEIVEKAFYKKFSLIKEWNEENTNFYNRKGYIQFLFGHRRSGYLSRNALSNYPIQGAAFHCLLWSLIQLQKLSKKEGWKTKIIGQIHDSIVFDLHPDEQDHVIKMAKKIMTMDIRKEFDFLIVPLEVEVEITDVNGSWYSKKKLKEGKN